MTKNGLLIWGFLALFALPIAAYSSEEVAHHSVDFISPVNVKGEVSLAPRGTHEIGFKAPLTVKVDHTGAAGTSCQPDCGTERYNTGAILAAFADGGSLSIGIAALIAALVAGAPYLAYKAITWFYNREVKEVARKESVVYEVHSQVSLGLRMYYSYADFRQNGENAVARSLLAQAITHTKWALEMLLDSQAELPENDDYSSLLSLTSTNLAYYYCDMALNYLDKTSSTYSEERGRAFKIKALETIESKRAKASINNVLDKKEVKYHPWWEVNESVLYVQRHCSEEYFTKETWPSEKARIIAGVRSLTEDMTIPSSDRASYIKGWREDLAELDKLTESG